MAILLGVDTGGTFTDFALYERGKIRIHKVLSTPEAPERAILQGIDELQLLAKVKAGEITIIHGSTVATNAALEGKGVRTAFITNKGFKDLLSIGRQTRRELYNLQPSSIEPPVASELCLEADCRTDAKGQSLQALSDKDLQRLVDAVIALKVDAVAINLLFSFLAPEDEQRIEAALRQQADSQLFISRSSYVLPEYKEYERGIATWLNAYLGPLVQSYLQRLQKAVAPSPLGVMQSSGGTIDAEQAGQRAVNLLLSGPAGGLAGANYLAELTGRQNLLTFDMGGTSTDVAALNLTTDGGLQLTCEGKLGHYPISVPMVDMHTIGAGGGSLARVDLGGLLQVGPESAGATPGPACYGRGGLAATVTDANAVLGRLRPDNFLGGAMTLDLGAAESVLDTIASPLSLSRLEAALGVIQLANEHMARALRVVSVERGFDPSDFQLCCFGGAGGLHVCALAATLNMHRAIVPVHGGVLSAVGMLAAPRERQTSQAYLRPLPECTEEQLQHQLGRLAQRGRRELQREGVTAAAIEQQPNLDLRYCGQSYTLNIPFVNIQQVSEDFHQLHQQRYGHRLNIDIELVNLRQRVFARSKGIELPTVAIGTTAPCDTVALYSLGQTNIYQRQQLGAGQRIKGPALICETVSTTLIDNGWVAEVDTWGNLMLAQLSLGLE
jgi:N-methylhydantoinase A